LFYLVRVQKLGPEHAYAATPNDAASLVKVTRVACTGCGLFSICNICSAGLAVVNLGCPLCGHANSQRNTVTHTAGNILRSHASSINEAASKRIDQHDTRGCVLENCRECTAIACASSPEFCNVCQHLTALTTKGDAEEKKEVANNDMQVEPVAAPVSLRQLHDCFFF
jgi:hypothetical protein